MVFLNAPQTADVILAFKLFSHYPLGSHDYTRIDLSCTFMKYECEVLREDTELMGDVHPHSVFDQCNCLEKVMRTLNICTSNCGSYFV